MAAGMFDKIGRPQPGYNPQVHGPYHPGRWYGKADVKLSEVQLAELGGWLSRRSKNPVDWARASNRAWWRWCTTWLFVKKPTAAPIVHVIAGLSTFYYFLQYRSHKYERHAKYHW